MTTLYTYIFVFIFPPRAIRNTSAVYARHRQFILYYISHIKRKVNRVGNVQSSEQNRCTHNILYRYDLSVRMFIIIRRSDGHHRSLAFNIRKHCRFSSVSKNIFINDIVLFADRRNENISGPRYGMGLEYIYVV